MENDNMNDFFNDPDNGWGFDKKDDTEGWGADSGSTSSSGSSGLGEEQPNDEFAALGMGSSGNESSYNMDNYTPSIPEPGPVQSAIHDINSSESKTKKLTTLVMVGAGIAVLIITLAVAGYMGSHKGKTKPVENTHVQITKEPIEQAEPRVEKEPSSNGGSAVQSSDGWQKLSSYSPLNEGTKIKSSFTITDIGYYAIPVNGQSDKQVKAVLTGSISGLVGTYQLEVNYSIGGQLNIGNSFDITYNLIEADGYKVIDGISY